MRPSVVSIAGFDPSSGAGVSSDIKTFEAHQVFGFGIVSALTYQNASHFEGVEWVSENKIIKQLEVLAKAHQLHAAKVGLIENESTLLAVLEWLTQKDIPVVWDPILKASAGFDFHDPEAFGNLTKVLKHLKLITPNRPEAIQLANGEDETHISALSHYHAALLLKGGHADGHANDVLYQEGVHTQTFTGDQMTGYDKHGTGCVLSASITAQLAKGKSLAEACSLAKTYVRNFMMSDSSLLGFHSSTSTVTA